MPARSKIVRSRSLATMRCSGVHSMRAARLTKRRCQKTNLSALTLAGQTEICVARELDAEASRVRLRLGFSCGRAPCRSRAYRQPLLEFSRPHLATSLASMLARGGRPRPQLHRAQPSASVADQAERPEEAHR